MKGLTREFLQLVGEITVKDVNDSTTKGYNAEDVRYGLFFVLCLIKNGDPLWRMEAEFETDLHEILQFGKELVFEFPQVSDNLTYLPAPWMCVQIGIVPAF